MRELLELAVPPYEGTGDWPAVLRDARVRRRRAPLAVALVAVAAAAVLAIALTGAPPSTLDRALAAAGDGRILHVVFDVDPAKTLVDLQTGASRELRSRHEVWFDPEGGLRDRETFAGVVQSDVSIPAAAVPGHAREIYGSLGAGYRDALRSGKAKVLRTGDLNGTPVAWIRIAPAHDVAVSRETYRPIYMRVGDGGTPILTYETIESAPLRADPVSTPNVFAESGTPISLARATAMLGRRPLWTGHADSVERVGDSVRITDGDTEITQARAPADLLPGAAGYTPPDGSVLLDGMAGLMRAGDLVVAIHAPDPVAVAGELR